MIYYVGDIHGRVDDVATIDRAAVKAGVDVIVQVGDFGVRWEGGCPIVKYFEKRARQDRPGPLWYTCGGNHENWAEWARLQEKQAGPGCAIDSSKTVELAPGCIYVVRGTTMDLDGKKHLFCGGAESTDKHMRIAGVDWWPEESPTYKEFTLFMDQLEAEKPDVVVTHDAPLRVPIGRMHRNHASTPRGLENIVKLSSHLPSRWYFGHHHIVDEWIIESVAYICCGLHGQYKEG